MNNFINQIWRSIMMQVSSRARMAINSKVSQGLNRAESAVTRKKKAGE